MPRRHVPIAAVVAPTAQHQNVRIRITQRNLGDGAPGLFHQQQQRHARIGSSGVGGAHLGSGKEFHRVTLTSLLSQGYSMSKVEPARSRG